MVETAAFDPVTFASILMREVDSIATAKYGDSSLKNRRRAFVLWCIKNISPELKDEEIRQAVETCETDSVSERPIQGAWIHDSILYFIQTAFSPLRIPSDPDTELGLELYTETPASEIKELFDKVFKLYQGATSTTSQKLVKLMEMYRQAVTDDNHIRLIVAIPGIPNVALLRTRDAINAEFRADKTSYTKHFCAIYDFAKLNEIVSENLGGIPGPEPLQFEPNQIFPIPNGTEGISALTATIAAQELIRIREKYDYKIYHSNFRYLLKKQGIARPKIQYTLETPSERANFWKYNNGITVTCTTITPQEDWRYVVDGLQVVNGLQTIEALYENRDKGDNTKGVTLLIRVIPTGASGQEGIEQVRQLERKIAEYSNSQTQITTRDLRSNDEVQRAIERLSMEVYGLKYVRKVGETGEKQWPRKYRVDNYEAGQAALSFWRGLANEATTKARLIFESTKGPKKGFYELIFTDSTTPEYVIFPYLLWESQSALIKKALARVKSPYQSLDLFALSVMGDLFISEWNLAKSPSRSRRQERFLQCAIESIRDLIYEKHDRKLRRLWRPIFEVLNAEVEQRRRSESKVRKLPLGQVTPRNIIVKMHYDKTLQNVVITNPKIKSLKKHLRNFFPC